jgi:tetratricopeptide (TPR) repeat protein
MDYPATTACSSIFDRYNSLMYSRLRWFGFGAVLTAVVLWGAYQLPSVRYHLEWRFDAALSTLRGWFIPGETLPVPVGAEWVESSPPVIATLPHQTPTLSPRIELVPTATPLPASVLLESPEWEKQDWNNCGPATLALGLRFYGWDGDQFDISALLKPDRGDRNVNIEELAFYVRTRAGWLAADYRVAGDLPTLKRFLAAGYPVIIEKGYIIEGERPDAGWAGHYLLLTGYDDVSGTFTAQDTFIGRDEEVTYEVVEQGWRAFNRVYMILYPIEQRDRIEALLGPALNEDANREHGLEIAMNETEEDPEDAFAWFNLGTNLLYFERYEEAAQAYDRSLSLGLPWRFTRYQFGPYIAYFNAGRYQDIIDLADATLARTNKAEESMLWRGWAFYSQGDLFAAIEDFRAALKVNPNYVDAHYALEYVGASP